MRFQPRAKFMGVLLFTLAVFVYPAQAGPSTPGIHESGFVPIGGIDQWVEIRGDSEANPVLLVVHGGPGATWDPLITLFKPWEKYFTLVIWDQRGAGRTYSRTADHNADDVSIDRIVKDGIELESYLSAHLRNRRIVVLGHSWGSLVGVRMMQERPDLFSAYVGTGQIVNTAEAEIIDYREVMRRAHQVNNEVAVSELSSIGEPPYDDVEKMGKERKWASLLAVESERQFNDFAYVKALFPPEFSIRDMQERISGSNFSTLAVYGKKLDGAITSTDLKSTATRFKMPVLLIQGAEDDITPTVLVKEYFQKLQAPHKQLVILAGGGHLAVMSMPDKFLLELRRRVLPLLPPP